MVDEVKGETIKIQNRRFASCILSFLVVAWNACLPHNIFGWFIWSWLMVSIAILRKIGNETDISVVVGSGWNMNWFCNLMMEDYYGSNGYYVWSLLMCWKSLIVIGNRTVFGRRYRWLCSLVTGSGTQNTIQFWNPNFWRFWWFEVEFRQLRLIMDNPRPLWGQATYNLLILSRQIVWYMSKAPGSAE